MSCDPVKAAPIAPSISAGRAEERPEIDLSSARAAPRSSSSRRNGRDDPGCGVRSPTRSQKRFKRPAIAEARKQAAGRRSAREGQPAAPELELQARPRGRLELSRPREIQPLLAIERGRPRALPRACPEEHARGLTGKLEGLGRRPQEPFPSRADLLRWAASRPRPPPAEPRPRPGPR